MATSAKQNNGTTNEPSALDKLRESVRNGERQGGYYGPGRATWEEYAKAFFSDMLAEDEASSKERAAKAKADLEANADTDGATWVADIINSREGANILWPSSEPVRAYVRGDKVPENEPAWVVHPVEPTQHSGNGTATFQTWIEGINGAGVVAAATQWRELLTKAGVRPAAVSFGNVALLRSGGGG